MGSSIHLWLPKDSWDSTFLLGRAFLKGFEWWTGTGYTQRLRAPAVLLSLLHRQPSNSWGSTGISAFYSFQIKQQLLEKPKTKHSFWKAAQWSVVNGRGCSYRAAMPQITQVQLLPSQDRHWTFLLKLYHVIWNKWRKKTSDLQLR